MAVHMAGYQDCQTGDQDGCLDSLGSLDSLDTPDSLDTLDNTNSELAAVVQLDSSSNHLNHIHFNYCGEADDVFEVLHNDENDETISHCGSFNSCHSRFGSFSDSSYYSFDFDDVVSDLNDDEQDDQIQSEVKDTEEFFTSQSTQEPADFENTRSVIFGVCDIPKNDNEKEEADDEFSPVKFYNSEEDINNPNLFKIATLQDEDKCCDSVWSDSNSVSSSGSSLVERSLDSHGSCNKSRLFSTSRRTSLSRRATVTTCDRKPWNYGAGSPSCQKLLWPVEIKKHSLV